ncbi:luciferin 4-monooxygenase-like [Oppia nitens]|uniref:luciferin 4-monooxygenase-like n=1 Tax=Oppia nitens TaxID=1686743 RepID=UPI0023DB83A9|nr:luciferin 4-monooxygenase-like [Oppia nitens]
MALNFGQYLRRECGLETGDIVCLITYNNDYHGIGVLGVLAAGGVYTSLDMTSTENEIQTTVSTIKPNILIGFEGNVDYLKQLKQNVDSIKTILLHKKIAKNDYPDDTDNNDLLITNIITNITTNTTPNKSDTDSDDNNSFVPISRLPSDMATLIMTSGSTGAQKAVIWTNRQWLANVSIRRHPEVMSPTDSYADKIILSRLYCHGAGIQVLFQSIVLGWQMVVISYPPDISLAHDWFFNILNKYNVSYCFFISNDLLYLLNNTDKYTKQYLQSVGHYSIVGQKVSQQLYDQIGHIYGSEKFIITYGMTECFLVMTKPFSRQHMWTSADNIGCVVPGMEVKIIDESGNSLPANQTGQICIRGPTLTSGYYGNKDVFTKFLTNDGFFMSGDLAYYDENEFFYFVDRIKDIIKFCGITLSPIELENHLLTHPSVEMAAVIGIDSELYVQIPMAFVTLNTGAIDKAGDIKEFVNKRVDVNKQLRGGLKILDKMPLTSFAFKLIKGISDLGI